MAKTHRLYLFPPALEKLYFFLLALYLVLFAIFGFNFNIDKNMMGLLGLFSSFVLLNNVHTYFTYMLILFTPEFRAIVVEKAAKKKWLFKVLGVAALILAASIFKAYAIRFDKRIDVFFVLLLGTLISYHAVAQTKGLSLLFNRLQMPLLSEADMARVKRIEKTERILFVPLIYLPPMLLIVRTLFGGSSILFRVAAGVMLLVTLAMIVNGLFYPRFPATSKKFFLLSLIFPACSSFSPLAVILVKCLHGLEYTFLSYAMLKRSAYRRSLFLGLAALIFFALLLGCNFYVRSQNHLALDFLPSKMLGPLTVLAVFSEFLHYYLDSEIFRLSDPVVYKNLVTVLNLASGKGQGNLTSDLKQPTDLIFKSAPHRKAT
jgi:hypothetical protein